MNTDNTNTLLQRVHRFLHISSAHLLYFFRLSSTPGVLDLRGDSDRGVNGGLLIVK